MHLTIKYFGLIAELTTRQEEDLEFSGSTVSDLLEMLHAKYPRCVKAGQLRALHRGWI